MALDDPTTMHVRRAARGDTQSRDWLVGRFSPLLRAQADYRIGAALSRFVDAEDLVQDVWVRSLPKLGDLGERDGRATPVLMKFLSVTLLRRLRDLVEKHVGKTEAAGTDLDALAMDRTGVVTLAMRGEDQAELSRQIDGLDPLDRALLVLRGIEQRGNAEAAAMLEMTPNAAAQRYGRALEKLRNRWPMPGSS